MSIGTMPGDAGLPLTDPAAYQQPARNCDIVMKGGITSGVVYPLAVCELARTYRFKSIGGTSAGAIAAALTAAAEHGRSSDQGGFPAVADIPRWIGEDDHLFHLFQPQRSTRSLFRLVAAFIGPAAGRAGRVLTGAARSFWLPALVGMLPGILLGIAALTVEGVAEVAGVVGAVLLIAIGAIAGVAIDAARQFLTRIPRNFFGMCTGADTGGTTSALTPWLHERIQVISGRTPADPPLTFGDLWGPGGEADKAIDLQMMTTNLTLGRGYRLPFDNDLFTYRSDELRTLFPESVVAHMDRSSREDPDYPGFRRLPAPKDFPIVVATRMSLSFPVMMSMIPLYAVDHGLPAEVKRPQVNWFSDGGIVSNFPVHFFDRPLPRWPTFTINLRGFPQGRQRDPSDESRNISSPRRNQDGLLESWATIESVPGFAGAIKSTMQNWLDNQQSRLPGFRDRIVHINFDGDEGGLNLKMPRETLGRLSERGRFAGVALRERFSKPNPEPGEMSWENHRWIRYRTAMSALEGLLHAFRSVYEHPEDGDTPYADLIASANGANPPSYAWRPDAQRAFAVQGTDEVVALAAEWDAQQQRFATGAPSPSPDLRLTPRV
jgi:hypothetical protein